MAVTLATLSGVGVLTYVVCLSVFVVGTVAVRAAASISGRRKARAAANAERDELVVYVPRWEWSAGSDEDV